MATARQLGVGLGEAFGTLFPHLRGISHVVAGSGGQPYCLDATQVLDLLGFSSHESRDLSQG